MNRIWTKKHDSGAEGGPSSIFGRFFLYHFIKMGRLCVLELFFNKYSSYKTCECVTFLVRRGTLSLDSRSINYNTPSLDKTST